MLPSLVGMIVDEPLHASWLGHPRAQLIYATMNRADDDPHLLATKLIAGKVTYVHERLWPALVTLGTANEDWQLGSLSPAARWLLHEVVTSGEVQTNLVVLPPEARDNTRTTEPLGSKRRAEPLGSEPLGSEPLGSEPLGSRRLGSKRLGAPRVADLARELERRLLVQADEIHTPSGAHAKVLQSWPRWAAEVHLPPPALSPAQARAALEEAAASLQAAAATDGAEVELPWRPKPRRQKRTLSTPA